MKVKILQGNKEDLETLIETALRNRWSMVGSLVMVEMVQKTVFVDGEQEPTSEKEPVFAQMVAKVKLDELDKNVPPLKPDLLTEGPPCW